MASWDLPIMPFGRHKGWPLDEIPGSYLRWLLTRELHEPLYSDVRAEAHRRTVDEEETHRAYRAHQRQQQSAHARHGTRPHLEDVDALISSGLKVLARKFHPDLAGGDLAKMQNLNAAADWLKAHVRELLS